MTTRSRVASFLISALVGLALVSGAAAASAPSATTGSASSIAPTTAHLNGTVNPNGLATTWYFEFGTTTSYGTNTAVESAGSGTKAVSESMTLTGLTPGTTYHFRLVASNASGTGFGADQTFATLGPPSVQTGAAQSIGLNTATVTGSVNPGGLSTTWYFEYGTTTGYGSKTSSENVGSGTSTLNVSAPITGLTPGTTDHYRLDATSTAGASQGSDLTFTTAPAVTLRAAALHVVHGSTVALSGAVSTNAAGMAVTVFAEPFGTSSFSQVGTALTGNNGAWSYLARPKLETNYQVSANGGTSSTVAVGVAPAVSLRLISKARFETRLSAGSPLAGRTVQLQRLSNGRWVTLKRARVSSHSTAIFSAESLPHGTSTIRIALSVNQAGPGVLAGFSRTLVYQRK